MGNNPDYLVLIIEQAIQKALQTNQNITNYYKTLNKHKKCSKCSTLKTTKIYKIERSVCKNGFNTNTLNLMKKIFGLLEENSSCKQDSSNKAVISNEQVRSRKQDTSSKQDNLTKIKTFNVKNYELGLLFRRFEELFNTPYYSETDYTHACDEAVIILDELLRIKILTRKE